jgi:chromosome segregation protein
LSRIEIKGFKSIARKTTLLVSRGVTCVAGPNGCGKSNIVDALRWAIGEQSARALRASAMNELIFSGTQDVPGASFASVALEFERDSGCFPKSLEGFDGFTVARRLYRTGESEYFINNVRCRLKDVTDLFLDTGLGRNSYAIVEQGRIKDIIQARPEEIRCLIEDAAEVGRFRVKRLEAIRRLDGAARNLERIRDLLDEVSKQRQDLKSQAAKAKRYQDLRGKANELERQVMTSEILRVRRRSEECSAELASLDERMNALNGEGSRVRERLSGLQGLSDAAKMRMEEISRGIDEAKGEGVSAEREMMALNARLKDMDAAAGALLKKTGEAKAALLEQQAQKDVLSARLEEVRRAVQGHRSELDAAEARVALCEGSSESAERAYQEKRTELFSVIAELRALEQREQETAARLGELEGAERKRRRDLDALEGEEAASACDIREIEKKLAELAGAGLPLEEEAAALEGACRSLGETIVGRSAVLRGLDMDLARAGTKIDMLESIAGQEAPGGGRPVNGSNGSRKVADAIAVREGFETAVGKSLGTALEFEILRDHDEMLSLEDIHERAPGFVIERPYVDPQADAPHGAIGRLEDFIEAPREFRGIVKALTQNLCVVDGLETAVSLWKEGHRQSGFVTRDGLVLERTGVLRTSPEGKRYADVLKARTELSSLIQARDRMRVEKERVEEELADARREERRIRGLMEELAKRRETLSGEAAALTERIKALSARQDRARMGMTLAREDLERIKPLRERLEGHRLECSRSRLEAENRRLSLEDALRALEGERLSARDAMSAAVKCAGDARERLHAAQVEEAEVIASLKAVEKAVALGQNALDADLRTLEELSMSRAAVLGEITGCRGRMEDAQERVRALETASKDALPEYEEAVNLFNACRLEADELRARMEALGRRRSELLLDARECDVALSMGMERIKARFGSFDPEVPEGFEEEAARREAAEIEQQIERMGQINFASVGAYEQVQKRWEDLHRQYEDLIQASTRLKDVIRNIERESARAYSATLSRVRKCFQEIFVSVFGGGRADLVEIPAAEEVEAGLEIVASPPFKRLKAMSLLSEGEKTLCAISLVFALFSVNPSPICVLDEVDAPLDDANITRLNRLIRSFSEDTQFLVVTHNRHTMEMSDIIYGVTFDVPGVSKVVSMELKPA